MARRKIIEEETDELTGEVEEIEENLQEGEDFQLSMDDFFSQELNPEEYEQAEKSLYVPTGRYFTSPPFMYKESEVMIPITITEDDVELRRMSKKQVGDVVKVARKMYRFWDKVYNADGVQYQSGFTVALDTIYFRGTRTDEEDNREFFLQPISGTKLEGASKNFHMGQKIYRKRKGEDAKARWQIIEFLQTEPLRLENRLLPPRVEGGDPNSWVAGFNLADA